MNGLKKLGCMAALTMLLLLALASPALAETDPGIYATYDFESGLGTEWSSSGDIMWNLEEGSANSGAFSERSGLITDAQLTALELTRFVQAGQVSFFYRVSSEDNYDFLTFYIDGIEQLSWSGDVPWTQVTFPVTEGFHTFRWEYSKDGSLFSGADAAWIDDVTLTTTPGTGGEVGPPVIAADIEPGGAINDLGEIVWSQFDPFAYTDQIVSSHRGPLTFDSAWRNHPALNNLGEVVWEQYGAIWGLLYGQTSPTLLIENGYAPDLNDLGEIVWVRTVSGFTQIFSSRHGQLTFDSADHSNPSISNDGSVVWTSNGNIYFLASGAPTPALIVNNGFMGSISNAGEVVFAQMVNGDQRLFSYDALRGQLTFTLPPYSHDLPDVNACGDVVFTSYDYGMRLYLLGAGAPCSTSDDLDGDQLPNGWEIAYNLDPSNIQGVNGPAGDPDNDGLPNLRELFAGTEPNNPDTDGDGLNDSVDPDPLIAPLAVPTNFAVPSTSTTGSFTLTWTLPAGAEGVEIEEIMGGATFTGVPTYVLPVAVTTLEISGKTPGIYSYQIRVTAPGKGPSAWVSGGNSCRVDELRVFSPNGGEAFLGGDIIHVFWSDSSDAASHTLRYSTDGGASWKTIVSLASPVTTYDWTAPVLGKSSSQCLLQVRALDGSGTVLNFDSSDAAFTIDVPVPVAVTYPNAAGLILSGGQSTNVNWSAATNAASYEVSYSLNGGATWIGISTVAAPATTLVWSTPIPASQATQCLIRVRARNSSNVVINSDVSNNVFTINVPVSVTYPNAAGLILSGGQSTNVNWSTATDATSYEVSYSLNGGSTWIGISTVAAPATTLVWTTPIPASQATQCLVRVRARNSSNVVINSDVSNNVFTINVPVSVTYPNAAGLILSGGQSTNVNWSTATDAASYEVSYSLDGGSTWIGINTVAAPATTLVWSTPIPASQATQCLVRVRARNSSNVVINSDVSNNFFTINVPVLVTYPNAAGLTLTGGQNSNVNWSAATDAASYEVSYSLNGGSTWIGISTVAAPATTLVWATPIPASQATQCLVRVRARNSSNVVINSDVSNNFFTLNTP